MFYIKALALEVSGKKIFEILFSFLTVNQQLMYSAWSILNKCLRVMIVGYDLKAYATVS